MHHIFVILINQPEYVLSLRSDGECIKKKSQETGKKISFLLLSVLVFYWEKCVPVEILVSTSFDYFIHLHSTPTNN